MARKKRLGVIKLSPHQESISEQEAAGELCSKLHKEHKLDRRSCGECVALALSSPASGNDKDLNIFFNGCLIGADAVASRKKRR